MVFLKVVFSGTDYHNKLIVIKFNMFNSQAAKVMKCPYNVNAWSSQYRICSNTFINTY